MFANTKAFSGFAVGDLEAAKKFYGETLGLRPSRGRRPSPAGPVPRIRPIPDVRARDEDHPAVNSVARPGLSSTIPSMLLDKVIT